MYNIDYIRENPILFTDCSESQTSLGEFSRVPINSGTFSLMSGNTKHKGIIRITSSTTANSGGYIFTNNVLFILTGNEIFECIFQHLVASGANTAVRIGLHNSRTSTEPTNGVYVELNGNLNLYGKTANSSTRSTTGTYYTISTNTWYRVRIALNSNLTLATYTLYDDNKNVLWTNTLSTNIPTNNTVGVGITATNSGTTATDLVDVDFVSAQMHTKR